LLIYYFSFQFIFHLFTNGYLLVLKIFDGSIQVAPPLFILFIYIFINGYVVVVLIKNLDRVLFSFSYCTNFSSFLSWVYSLLSMAYMGAAEELS
jgi:hypothetical protein